MTEICKLLDTTRFFSRHIQYDSLKLDYRTTLRNKNYDKGEDNLSDGGIFAGQKNTPDGVGGDRK